MIKVVPARISIALFPVYWIIKIGLESAFIVILPKKYNILYLAVIKVASGAMLKLAPTKGLQLFFYVKFETVKLIGGRWIFTAMSGLNGRGCSICLPKSYRWWHLLRSQLPGHLGVPPRTMTGQHNAFSNTNTTKLARHATKWLINDKSAW